MNAATFSSSAIAAVPIAIAVLQSGCNPAPKPAAAPAEASFPSVGTQVYLRVSAARRSSLPGLMRHTRRLVKEIEQEISVFRPDSEINTLNRTAGISSVPLSEDTYRLLVLAQKYCRMTEGAFDPTVAPAAALWGLHGKPPVAPPQPDVTSLTLVGGGCQNIVLTNQTAFLLTKQTRVDLGGIGIGYIIDRVVVSAREEGFRSFLIQIGNHARGVGRPAEQENWRIPLPDPFLHHLTLAEAEIPLNQALAVSIQGLNAPVVEGIPAGPVLDPRTGMPATNIALCAVWAPTATLADALATAGIVLGVEGMSRLRHRFADCRILLVENSLPPNFWVTEQVSELVHWKARHPEKLHKLEIH